MTKGEIRKLRRKSHDFVSIQMLEIMKSQFQNYGIAEDLFQINVDNTKISDQDPETIKIEYPSVFNELSYIPHKVLIEISARSLMRPSEEKEIISIIDEYFPKSHFAEASFCVNTVIPEKTFLEKLILLHEEFKKPKEKIRYYRMSRHLYDIGQIISTKYGQRALNDKNLFNEIISHRKILTPVRGVDYEAITLKGLEIIPPDSHIGFFRKDYAEMQENMIYGKNLDFDKLIQLLKEKL